MFQTYPNNKLHAPARNMPERNKNLAPILGS